MISIALPIHNMDRAEFYLTRCLDSILDQTYEDFEIVITDNSPDDRLEKLIRTYAMKIRYTRNEKNVGMAANINRAIKRCEGNFIKFIFMDDWLAHKDALKDIAEGIKGTWLFTASDNNKWPRYTTNIHTGNNKLGSPSAMTIRNIKPMLFDEQMTWLLDCDYYRRMGDKHGEPTVIKKVGVNIGIHDGQTTNLLTEDEKMVEGDLMDKRYV